METQDLISMIDDYAAKTGLSRTTICERATGNSRLYARLKKRAEYDAEVSERFADFVKRNPAEASK